MEYHQQLNTYHNQQHYSAAPPPPGQSNIGLPDSQQASSSEKALMWSAGTYMTESGYSTQAPSISSIDAFLNNEQIDSTMQNIETASTVSSTVNTTTKTAPAKVVEQPQYVQLQPPAVANPPQQQQQPAQQHDELLAPTDQDNAVANWMSSENNSEQAIEAIPDLLKLLMDDDLVVVQQAALYLNHMTLTETSRDILIRTPNFVQCIVNCLFTTKDLETARPLIGALYGISQNKTLGVKALVNSTALIPIIKMLEFPTETIVNYAIVTLHNVLSADSESKVQLTKMGAVHNIVPLLKSNKSLKFLSIVVDTLHYLALANPEAKNIIFELRGTEMLIMILMNHSTAYKKLFYNTIRLMKVLSIDAQSKQLFIQHNVIQTLAMHLNTIKPESNGGMHDLLHNLLITIRNLSDAAIKLNGLESVVVNLIQLLNAKSSSKDSTIMNLIASILSNMTCNNEYKKCVARSNGVQVLLKILHLNLTQNLNVKVLDPVLCVLKHITNRHPDMLLCQEQIRNMNGLQLVTDLMAIQPRSWTCIKPLLGLVRNLCSNQLNSTQLRELNIIAKLMQIMYDAYTEINMRTNNGMSLTTNKQQQIVVKVEEDVNLCDIIDSCAMILLILAKEYQDQMSMKQLDCIGFFIQMFFSPIINNQKAASSILAELASNKECALLIEQTGSLHHFIQINFCNQFGMLKSIAELNSNNSNASIVLKNVHTLMQRLQEHRQAAVQPQQQQQQQSQMIQHQQQIPRNNSYPGQYPPQQIDAYRQQQAYYQQQQYPGAGFPPNQQFY
jgi:hypothetical protein